MSNNRKKLYCILAGLALVAVGYFIGANSKPDIKVKTEVEIQEEINKKVALKIEEYKKSLKIEREFDPKTGNLVKEKIEQNNEGKKQDLTAEVNEKKDFKFVQEIEIRKKNFLGILVSQPIQVPNFKIEPHQNLDLIYKHENLLFGLGTNTQFNETRIGIGTGFSF